MRTPKRRAETSKAAAKAAFGLGLLLGEADDTAAAVQAYQISIDLGRSSQTAEGLEAASKATFNLQRTQKQAEAA